MIKSLFFTDWREKLCFGEPGYYKLEYKAYTIGIILLLLIKQYFEVRAVGMVHVNYLLKSHSWRIPLLPAVIPDAIAPFAGSSAPWPAAVITVSEVLPSLSIHAHAWTHFTARTPFLLPCVGKGGLRGNVLSFLYSPNTWNCKCISLAAVSYEVSRKEIQNLLVERVMFLFFQN